MLLKSALTAIFVLAASAAWAGPGHDHGGHDDGPPPPSTQAPRLESVGSGIELVATAEGHRLVMFLDRPDTNEPIGGATIEVSGEGITSLLARETEPGMYELEADWVDQPGSKALVFSVTAGTEADLLNGIWKIDAAGESAATVRTAPLTDALSHPFIMALLAGAVALGFVLALAFRTTKRRAIDDNVLPTGSALEQPARPIALRSATKILVLAVAAGAFLATETRAGPGHDHGEGGHDSGIATAGSNAPRKLPDGSVFVPKLTQRLLGVRTRPAASSTAARVRELIGTVIPDPSSFGLVQAPMDGQIEVGARGISYAGQEVTAGEVLALLAPSIPVADLGTMQQLRAEVAGKLVIAEQKLDRLTRIASVVAKSQIDDTRAEIVALREQQRVLQPKDTELIPLKAPVSGTISVATVRAGQVVSARDTLFEIVDPKKLWVEGIGDAGHAGGEIASAQAVDGEGHALKLSYAGRSPTLRQQSRPSLFRIDEEHSGLAIGAPLKIVVQAEGTVEGIELPAAAVVRADNGLARVWIKEGPERFRAATVKTEPIDGERVLAVAGIKPGERVVTVGAEIINQIR